VLSLIWRIDDEDGSEMLDAAADAAAAAGTWTDSDLHQPGCIISYLITYLHETGTRPRKT